MGGGRKNAQLFGSYRFSIKIIHRCFQYRTVSCKHSCLVGGIQIQNTVSTLKFGKGITVNDHFRFVRNFLMSTIGYRNAFDWFQEFLSIDIQSVQDWQQINVFFLRL